VKIDELGNMKLSVHVIARSEATRRSGVKNKIATSLALLAMTWLASFSFDRNMPYYFGNLPQPQGY
jgi:hypothetical protein